MRRNYLILSLLLLCGLIDAKVVEKPFIECRANGLYDVEKIELNDTSTRVYIHNTFLPGWWIEYVGDEKIFDSTTGKGFSPIGIEGIGYKERLYMPPSGDTTIVLIYPKLDEKIENIDFGRDGWIWIYGISLSKPSKPEEDIIPQEVEQWLNASLEEVPRSEPIDYESDLFFKPDTAHLRGYIKGYDTRLGFKTGLVYMENVITDEDYPTVVRIYPDGRFEADLYFYYPQWQNVIINNNWVPFYLEPGQTLVMLIDWDDFLDAQIYRDRMYQFTRTEYRGPLKDINRAFAGLSYKQTFIDVANNQIGAGSVEAFLKSGEELEHKAINLIEDYAAKNEIPELAKEILICNVKSASAENTISELNRQIRGRKKEDQSQEWTDSIYASYYSVFDDFPANDRATLACMNYSSLVNRLRFCRPMYNGFYKRKFIYKTPEVTFRDYLLKEKPDLTEDEKDQLDIAFLAGDSTNGFSDKDRLELEKELLDKYQTYYLSYKENYLDPLEYESDIERFKYRSAFADSVLSQKFGIGGSLTAQIVLAQSADFNFKHLNKKYGKRYLPQFKKPIAEPFILSEIDRLYEKVFPDDDNGGYELPKGIAANVFKKIVDPFKGKVLFVDFWATSCGPCVGGIKRMKEVREKYADNPNFEFIFITDDRSSPEARYNDFIKEQGLVNTYRLPKDDFNYLRQLFRFNGIPHYALIDKDGKVLNDNYYLNRSGFDRELNKLGLK